MTVELMIRWAKGVIICAVAVWELIQLARHRDDLALRVLAPGLVLLAFAATMGIHTPLLEPIRDFFGSAWSSIINGCWMAMAYCWATYFLMANSEMPAVRRKRIALVELGFLVGAIAVMVVMREIAPPEIWRPSDPEQRRAWQRVVWYLAVDGYALAAWFLGVRRALMLRRKLSHPWARTAFWVVIAGSAAMALGVDGVSLVRQGVRVVAPGFDPDVLSTLYSIGQLGGQFMLALGLALAPLATILVRIRARHDRRLRARYIRRLMPLWRVLTAEFPYVALAGVHTGHREDDDFERVTAEITDGLGELARYCPEPDGDMRDPRVAADVIASGLSRRVEQQRAQWAGDEVAPPEPPYPRLEPDFPDWRGRARWMIAVGAGIRARGLIGEDEHEWAAAG